MDDYELQRGCADEWEPGEDKPPAWLAGGVVMLVLCLAGIAAWCWSVVAG